MNAHPVVETRGLTKVYGDGAQIVALDHVNLVVEAGEFMAIVGPSGSGKSTLLNLIGALDRPSAGDILVNGTSLKKVRDLDGFRSRTVGFVFQMHNLIPTLTAEENVAVPMHETVFSVGRRKAHARELLNLVGLGSRAGFLPSQMSGGERQRVAIARALANEPSLILADEPTGNLDTHNTAETMRLLAEINRVKGTAVIAVTHNHEVASAMRRIVTLRDGRVMSDVAVRSAYDRDLVDFKNSPLGRAIVDGAPLPPELADAADTIRRLFERI